MNKIYKLLDTYIDVSKIKTINDNVICTERSNPHYSIVIDGNNILLGDSSKFEKFAEYSEKYSEWFSLYFSRDLDQAYKLEQKLNIYTQPWDEDVKKKISMFVEYWKTYTNQFQSNGYVRDH